MQNLNLIKDKLKRLAKKQYKSKFAIPSLWLEINEPNVIEINPYEFFIERFERIIELSKSSELHSDFKAKSGKEIIYNLFIRYACTYDHNSDANVENLDREFKETGTFLKAIVILPYIKSLGVNIVYLLPITSIGIDGKKGNLGSPYAIRNPYKLDDNLSEPMLDISIDDEFRAFTEACHLLGIKVVSEFVFRTASIDSEIALEHPEWFYWIKSNIKNREIESESTAQYGSPIFLKRELKEIKENIEAGNLEDTLAPSDQYKRMFYPTPTKVARVEAKILGVTTNKDDVRIPGAFADWPPDDNQPAWSDVTYLKLYEHQDFNYIAYNTVRFYDNKLSKKENKNLPLWEYITNIVPHYQKEFNIDGVMIDMGHALPNELLSNIISKARENNPKFIFWEENFSLSEVSLKNGYDAVLGYLCFDNHSAGKIYNLLQRISSDEYKTLPAFFATAETHNMPRASKRFSNIRYNSFAYALNSLLPALSFIHNGFELCETNPVNTGLDFTIEQIEEYPSDKLPLFSTASLNWKNDNIVETIRQINNIKNDFDFLDETLAIIETNNINVIAFSRLTNKGTIVFVGSMLEQEIEAEIYLNDLVKLKDISNIEFEIENKKLELKLNQFDFKILFSF